MPHLPTLLALFISFVLCFLDTTVAAPKADCSPSVSVSAAASQTASSSRAQPSETASASSGRPSSTRQLPSGTASQPSSTDSNGCLPYSTTTRTKTTFVNGPTVTETFTYPTFTVLDTTSYFDLVTGSIVPVYDATTTFTTTLPSVVNDDTAVSSTVSVPAPPGLTPVSCLPAYLDPTFTSTQTTTYTTAEAALVIAINTSGVMLAANYTSTTTWYSIVTTAYETVTSTSTITRASATVTEYAACASNNIVFDGPFDSYLNIPEYRDGIQLGPGFMVTDPTECCTRCLNDPQRVLGSGVLLTGGGTSCILLTKTSTANTTCDPTFQAAEIRPYSEPLIPLFVSNSGCGQYAFI